MPFGSFEKFVELYARFFKLLGPRLLYKMQERALDGRQAF